MLRRFGIIACIAVVMTGAAAAQAPNPSFNVVNRTASAINQVFATPAGMTSWGRDRIGNRPIPPGQTGPVRLPADGNCVYDVRVVYANGQADERRGLNTCNVDNVIFPSSGGRNATPSSRQQAADDPSFRLVNRGRSAVNELYASAEGEDDWGEDRLGEETVAPGAARVVRLPNGQCLYDVRIVYANGEATEKRHLNLCGMNDMRVP
jgi:hypothetical protein